jgi:hypothetical protein
LRVNIHRKPFLSCTIALTSFDEIPCAVVILSNAGKGNEFLIPAACFCEKEFPQIKSNKQVERRILKEGWLAIHPKIHL